MRSIESISDALERGLSEWQDEIFRREANKIGLKAVASVKALTPVRTGTLRRRWHARIDKEGGDYIIRLTNNTVYAPAVNYGRRKGSGGMTSGAHMLERGIANYKASGYEDDIRQMIEEFRRSF